MYSTPPHKYAIIGGGAAGCFAAIFIAEHNPSAHVTIYEAGTRLLAKVAVTGGGRCNLTNSFEGVKSLERVYPRGHRLMKRLFCTFDHREAMSWFEQRGVRLVTQDDHCVFPHSQDAMEIVATLHRGLKDVEVKVRHRVSRLSRDEQGRYHLLFSNEMLGEKTADRVIVTTGGWPKHREQGFLAPLGLKIEKPVASLFGLCVNNGALHELTGTVVEDVVVGLTGSRLRAEGPLLITHWGLSGPAILRLSSYGARQLAEVNYRATLSVNWLGETDEASALGLIGEMAVKHSSKQLASVYPTVLNSRLWRFLLEQSGLNPMQRWGELGKKSYHKLANTLINSCYPINGRNRMKEEFVTCGGVALSEIHPHSLESKHHPGLFFAGEVLDVDAVTGGFNLQAAWTMGRVAAQHAID